MLTVKTPGVGGTWTHSCRAEESTWPQRRSHYTQHYFADINEREKSLQPSCALKQNRETAIVCVGPCPDLTKHDIV